MRIPDPSRQIAFHQLLVGARKAWLSDALAAALDSVDVRAVKRELDLLVPADVQRILSRAGIRDEYVFPKGGTDKSNVHNRTGEAEKSHQKAKAAGYREFWTIIALGGIDRETLKSESPTTQSWFDAAHVLGRTGADWEAFGSRLAGKVGIPVSG